MTPKEFAKRSNYSYSQVKYLIRTGKLRAKKKTIPTGFIYEISEAELKRIKALGKDNRGWNSVNPIEEKA